MCGAVEASAEYDPSEPAAVRSRAIGEAVSRFRERFGRPPGSVCAPDYRWDDQLEADAEALGVTIIQGSSERHGQPFRRLRHRFGRLRWHARRGRRFDMPPRIAFEPRGETRPDARLGAADAHARVRAAWGRGQPAVVSSHRLSYAHLDAAWSDAGRAALRDLLGLLSRDGAVFLTDAEVRSLEEHGWSLRPLTDRTSLLRHHGASSARVRVPAPAGAVAATLREARDGAAPRIGIEGNEAIADLAPGTWIVEWTIA